MNELGKLTGAGGCQLINAAGTYAISDGSLIAGVVSLVVVTGGAAAITALQIKPEGKTAIALPTVHKIVGATLPDNAVLTFRHPISTLTVAAAMVIIAYAG
jgi:hypothetical protein